MNLGDDLCEEVCYGHYHELGCVHAFLERDGVGDDELLKRLDAYSENMCESVKAKDAKLKEVGYKNYNK